MRDLLHSVREGHIRLSWTISLSEAECPHFQWEFAVCLLIHVRAVKSYLKHLCTEPVFTANYS